MSNDILDMNPETMMEQVRNTSLATWSDDKRREFKNTFEARARAARAILILTQEVIMKTALRRQFIGEVHLNKIPKNLQRSIDGLKDPTNDNARRYGHNVLIGGREYSSLLAVAQERAEAILKNLPPLKKAVQIIDPETAKKIDRRDLLIEKGTELSNELIEYKTDIKLSELDQNMTIGEFRAYVKNRNEARKSLVKKLNELGKEGQELENAINKVLFKGLPGLSDAVMKVAIAHLERAESLDQMTRRVGELVMFGDSEEAMAMLQKFEKDELGISDSIKEEFMKGMEALKASIKAAVSSRKALKEKK